MIEKLIRDKEELITFLKQDMPNFIPTQVGIFGLLRQVYENAIEKTLSKFATMEISDWLIQIGQVIAESKPFDNELEEAGKPQEPEVIIEGTIETTENNQTILFLNFIFKIPEGKPGRQGIDGMPGPAGKTVKPIFRLDENSNLYVSYEEIDPTTQPQSRLRTINNVQLDNATVYKPVIKNGTLSFVKTQKQDELTNIEPVNITGPYYQPTIDEDGLLTWKAKEGNQPLQNIQPINILGSTYMPRIDAAGNLTWKLTKKPIENLSKTNLRGPRGFGILKVEFIDSKFIFTLDNGQQIDVPLENAVLNINQIKVEDLDSFKDIAHPVGTIYETALLNTPELVGLKLGGVWERYSEGQVTCGYKENVSPFNLINNKINISTKADSNLLGTVAYKYIRVK